MGGTKTLVHLDYCIIGLCEHETEQIARESDLN